MDKPTYQPNKNPGQADKGQPQKSNTGKAQPLDKEGRDQSSRQDGQGRNPSSQQQPRQANQGQRPGQQQGQPQGTQGERDAQSREPKQP